MHVRGSVGFLVQVSVLLGASWLSLACDSAANGAPAEPGGGAGSGGTALGANPAASGAPVGGAPGGSAGATNGGVAGAGIPADSLAKKYADFFPIGAAVGYYQLTVLDQVLVQDFNHLTCENAMKAEDIHPVENTYSWLDADGMADFARQHGMKLTGHALLWHQRTPAWMFDGVTAGDITSLELLKARLKAHIEAVVDRYADVVDNWDVVNEAISDDPTKTYRDGTEGSKWFEVFASQEYVYWAFKYAKDALEAKAPGSSVGKLYYNEYASTVKADRILEMLAWLKDEKGLQIDGVGFQSHENMTWPSAQDLQTAFDKFSAAGYKIKISELDVTVYSDYSTGSFVPSPAVTYTAELAAAQAKRFADLFALYRKNESQITSVTFWGISDDQSWLDESPVAGRDDFPLLYDAAHAPKAARAAILNF